MNPDVRAVAAEMRDIAFAMSESGYAVRADDLYEWASALESASQSDAVDAARYRYMRGHDAETFRQQVKRGTSAAEQKRLVAAYCLSYDTAIDTARSALPDPPKR